MNSRFQNFYQIRFHVLMGILILYACFGCKEKKEAVAQKERKPNILFCISDDQSWLHTSFAKAKELQTPAFDLVATKGAYFSNAYCAASSCAPSRASILTGQDIWRLGVGGLLFGALPKEHQVFTQLLRDNGYATVWTGKGYAPAKLEGEAYWNEPLGKGYHQYKGDYPENFMDCDYAANFELFMEERDPEQPFFFWYGGHEPHRIYDRGAGIRTGKNADAIEVPSFLPEHDIVRSDIADYYYEIEWFDRHLAKMIKTLEATGELDHTIIIVTADNGMPFPRAKTTNYEYGTHMPLAICWGDKIKGSRTISDFVSFTDFGPTLLEAAGVDIPKEMTGQSFLSLLTDENARGRQEAVSALERHTYCRPDGMPYPIRSLRKGDYLYIYNFEPDRWPAGDADFYSPHQGYYGDVDTGATREYMITQQNDPKVAALFSLSFGKRPQAELYNVSQDPENQYNLIELDSMQNIREELHNALFAYLKRTNDPRMEGKSPWDHMPYYFEGYENRHLKPIGERDLKNLQTETPVKS